MTRHHQQIENIENKRLKLEEKRQEIELKKMETMEWRGKADQLSYKVKLVKEYQNLVTSGMSNEQIEQLFPEMDEVIKTFANNNST